MHIRLVGVWLLVSIAVVCGAESHRVAEIPSDTIRTIFAGRAVERLIVVLGAWSALYFGFRLFEKGLASDAGMDAGAEKYYLRLRNIGPGVFFAMFGTIVSLYTLFAAPELVANGAPGEVSASLKGITPSVGASNERAQLDLLVRSVVTVERYGLAASTSDAERTALREAIRNLESVKDMLVDARFGKEGAYAEWRRLDALQSSDPAEFARLPSETKERFHEINELVSSVLMP
jgi:hypothetical protein